MTTTSNNRHIVSIIVPTFNRPAFLHRLLSYLTEVKCDHPILVADSSSPTEKKANEKNISVMQSHLDLSYKSYHQEIAFYDKIVDALQHTKTDYAVFCADDDFIIPRSVRKCVDFLQDNVEYTVAHGQVASIQASSDIPINKIRWRSKSYRQCMVESNDPVTRFREHTTHYTATFYSVHRRDQLIDYLTSASHVANDYRFGEWLPSWLTLIDGKAKKVETLYMIRQTWSSAYSATLPSWHEAVTSTDFLPKYKEIVNFVAKKLTEISHLNLEEATKIANACIEEFLSPSRKSKTRRYIENSVKRTKRLLEIWPRIIFNILARHQWDEFVNSPREFYRHLLYEHEMNVKKDVMAINQLLSPDSPYYLDFQPIYEHLVRYPYGIA